MRGGDPFHLKGLPGAVVFPFACPAFIIRTAGRLIATKRMKKGQMEQHIHSMAVILSVTPALVRRIGCPTGIHNGAIKLQSPAVVDAIADDLSSRNTIQDHHRTPTMRGGLFTLS
jgi:hypothetical protein